MIAGPSRASTCRNSPSLAHPHAKPASQVLYAGVKQTKDGLEIKMHDQQKALENVARHLGMFQDKLVVEGRLSLEELVMGALRKEQAEKGDHQP